MIVVFTCCV